jgi:hypothetical protein
MDGTPFHVPLMIEGHTFTKAMVDSGCECFSAIDKQVARRSRGQFINIPPQILRQAAGSIGNTEISQLVVLKYDLDGWVSHLVAYVVPDLSHEVILRRP